jgi:hypothetical protein
MKYPKAGDLQRATGVQITSNPSPKYSERRGWTGGDSRTLYAIEDQRTGRVVVRPGGELAGIGSEAVVRIATRAEAEEHWQGQLHAGWHVAESNPHAPKQNPWEVHSDSGLEGVFFDEDSARFFAEEIRGGGARGIRVERRVKRPPHRNPPSGRWAGASLTLTNIAQNMEVLGVSGCNSLLKYVPVEVARVGYGWLFKCLPDGHDVVVEMDGGGMQTFAASQVTPVAGRVPESPTQLALRAKYKAEDEDERRERGNPAPGLGHRYVLGSNPIKMHRNPTFVGFHGSTRPIKDPTTMPMSQGDFGVGMYFSTSEVDAGRYGFDTYRSSLQLESPFIAPAERTPELDRVRIAFGINEEDVYDDDEGSWHGLVELLNMMIELGLLGKKKFIAIMRKLGYDGIVVPNEVVRLSRSRIGNRRAKGDYIVVFDFASIKSWDPAFATHDEWATAYRASMGEHENPARVTRERYGDSADIVIEHNRYGYTGWLESKRGGGRRPISFGATRPTNAQEALALAKKFLAGVHGRNNPSS